MEKPSELMKVCNTQPCPAQWSVGPWTKCPPCIKQVIKIIKTLMLTFILYVKREFQLFFRITTCLKKDEKSFV